MNNDLQKTTTMNQHLDTLERGKFSQELNDALRAMVGDIENAAAENGGKAKGEISIKMTFKLDKGIYELAGDFKATPPKKRRNVTHAWGTPDNFLSPQNPNQVEMFSGSGARIVGATEGARLA